VRITIDLGDRSYPVIIGSHFLENAVEHLSAYVSGNQVCIVTNDVIAPLYLHVLKEQLEAQYQVSTVVLPDGESNKNLETLNIIFETLLKNACNRDVTLIALGGGVVGDMTGFAAASFMRGVNFIQIPTTLLAQVDSSVGGKTGVNHALGKNMIGAFYQPQCVLIDVNVLKSLPQRELSAGLAEVIKYGFIADEEFLTWLEVNISSLNAGEENALMHAIKKSCECKANVVSQDEQEKGLRAILNLGHTFGHAIEAYYQYKKFLHGEAVAIGTHMALKLSQLMENISEADLERGKLILMAAKLPVSLSEQVDCDLLIDFMKVDKKAKSGQIRLVLLEEIGKAIITNDFPQEAMRKAMMHCMPN
jgi:3-dehydroquinate synthase